MTMLCSTMDAFSLGTLSVGVSAEADILEKSVKESFDHYLRPRLELLIPELEGLADASDFETIRAAIRFAYCLPRFAPLPEVSVDPDGEISFDWLSPSGEMFSVSVNKENRLAYAGWFGEKSRFHGIEQLAENCPQEILRGIQKATASDQSERRWKRTTKALHGSN
jgi:hypothetical protein